MEAENKFYLPFTKIRFCLTVEKIPQDFPGFVIRGAVINYLRFLKCIHGRECWNCKKALWKPYETIGAISTPWQGWFLEIISPNINQAPSAEVKNSEEGEKIFKFEIGFLGKYTCAYPYFIHAIKNWTKRGIVSGEEKIKVIGIKIEDTITQRELKDFAEITNIFDLVKSEEEKRKESENGKISSVKEDFINVNFLTPFLPKLEGKNIKNPDRIDFNIFFSSVSRRIISEMHAWDKNQYLELIKKFKKLRELAEGIEVVEREITFSELIKHSSRQKKKIKIGGFRGRIKFKGDFSQLYEFIKIGEIIHIGKGVRMGLGKFNLSLE